MAPPSPPLAVALRQVCEVLAELRVGYALVGGLAVSARAEPRLTRDVDLAIAAEDDRAAEQLVRDLRQHGYRVTLTIEQSRTGRLATVRFVPPGGTKLVVDLLFASCGIEREIVDVAEWLEILPGLTVPVARTEHLIAMKLLARDDRDRPQDLDDLRALLEIATTRERRQVTSAIKLIEARGFARGRDLQALWRELRSTRARRAPGR